MKKILSRLIIWILMFWWVFAAYRLTNWSSYQMIANEFLFTSGWTSTWQAIMDINTGGNVIVYGPLKDWSGNIFITWWAISWIYLLISNSWTYFNANSWIYFNINSGSYFQVHSWEYFEANSWNYYTTNPLGYITGSSLSTYLLIANSWDYYTANPLGYITWLSLSGYITWYSETDPIWILASWNYLLIANSWDYYTANPLWYITWIALSWYITWYIETDPIFMAASWSYLSVGTGVDGKLCQWSGAWVDCNVEPASWLVETDPIWNVASGNYLLITNSWDYFNTYSWDYFNVNSGAYFEAHSGDYYTLNPLWYITGGSLTWVASDGSTWWICIFTGDGSLVKSPNFTWSSPLWLYSHVDALNAWAATFYDNYNWTWVWVTYSFYSVTKKWTAGWFIRDSHTMYTWESMPIVYVTNNSSWTLSGWYIDSSAVLSLVQNTFWIGNIIQVIRWSVLKFRVDYLGDTYLAGNFYPQRIVKRVSVVPSTWTITPNGAYDIYQFTWLSQALTFVNSTATMFDGEQIKIRITDNGTGQSFTWGTGYVAKAGIALPSVTVTGKMMVFGFERFSSLNAWNLLALSTEA